MLSKINNYTDFFNKFQRNNVIFGLEVQIPIFASHTSSSVAFAQADLNAANLALENKRSELSLDVRRKARQVREADLGGEVARLELQLAQENVRVLQVQFDQGRGSLKDLEAAHLDENDKWLAYLDANYARQQAELDLLQTTGQACEGAAVAQASQAAEKLANLSFRGTPFAEKSLVLLTLRPREIFHGVYLGSFPEFGMTTCLVFPPGRFRGVVS